MLSADLASELDVAKLRSEYEGMIAYGRGPATQVRVVIAMDYWPGKQPGDIGWAYTAISGDSFTEAIAVTVAEEKGRAVIRAVEWGRP